MSKARSLSFKLLAQLSALLGLAGLSMVVLTVAVIQKQVEAVADRDLAIAAKTLVVLMHEEIDSQAHRRRTAALLSREDVEAFKTASDWREFAILRNGTVAFKSARPIADSALAHDAGYHDFRVAGARWRSFTRAAPEHGLSIVVAEPMSVRTAVIRQILSHLTLPLLGLLVGAWVCLWLALKHGLRDLGGLSSVVSRRSAQDLEPLSPTPWARELHGLIGALNRLFERVKAAFEHEQMFTAMAAHQLRTPLATLRVQAQLLRKGAPEDLRGECDDLLLSIDRATSSVEQMLRLSRLQATSLRYARVDLTDLIGRVVGEHAVAASQAGVEIALDVGANARWLITDGEVLHLALSNLVENAIRHAATGGELRIATRVVGRRLAIDVLDRGPGIPMAQRVRALEPYQTLGSQTGRSGLGLAIVTRAVAILGGTVTLDERTDGPGLVVTLITDSKPPSETL